MRVLVTGGNGFLGSLLAQTLAGRGDEVVASHHQRIAHSARSGVRSHPLDVRVPAECLRLVREVQPDLVAHFAGIASVSSSWNDPLATFRTNLDGTLNMLEAFRAASPRSIFLFAGSGTEYGTPSTVPTPETAPLDPGSPYAASKAAADVACRQYFVGYGLDVRRLRFFGVTGVGKRSDFCNDVAAQIAEKERGADPSLALGNLERRRDILDGRDAIRAVVSVLERGEAGEAYNVGRGTGFALKDLLEQMLSKTPTKFSVTTAPTKVRRADAPVQEADITRLKSLGWAPEVEIGVTVQEILDDWRARVRAPDAHRTA